MYWYEVGDIIILLVGDWGCFNIVKLLGLKVVNRKIRLEKNISKFICCFYIC